LVIDCAGVAGAVFPALAEEALGECASRFDLVVGRGRREELAS